MSTYLWFSDKWKETHRLTMYGHKLNISKNRSNWDNWYGQDDTSHKYTSAIITAWT